MVKDGIFYALGLWAAATALWLVSPWLAAVPILLSAFFLWFFRDPERTIPSGSGLVVSPADGKVTFVGPSANGAGTRISIFLNVFSVHVNRSPIAGVIKDVRYQTGKFHNAMDQSSSDDNEQNIVTVAGEDQTVVFKQIAGLLARRIVFTHKTGDPVGRGERIGLIKFGSRVDVLLAPEVEVVVSIGDHVAGGANVLGRLRETVGVRSAASQIVGQASALADRGGQ